MSGVEEPQGGHASHAAEIGSDVHNDIGSVTEIVGVPAPVRASDPHDFAGLYLRHRASFTLHARRYLKDQRDADEVVQEAFLRLFLALPELETELQALAYCRRTITNLAIDRYRADARRPKLVDLDSAPVDELAGDEVGDPVVRAEEAALVRDALAQLPSLHRAALVKREIEEKPLSVIADELDIPEDNVKHVLFRARRGLRKLLARTSVAPGADVEAGPRLARPKTSGAVALALLLALGLGSGPDLEAVPVVGVDLPDVIGVTRLVETVGDAVARVLPGGDGPETGAAGEDRPRVQDSPADQPSGGGTATQPSTGSGAAAGATKEGPATVVPGAPATGRLPAAPGVPPAVTGPERTGSGASDRLERIPGSSGPGGVGTRPDSPTGGIGTGTDRDAAERADRTAEEATRAAERAARERADQAERAARDQASQADRAAKDQADRAAREQAAADEAAKDRAEAAGKVARDQAKAAEKAAKDRAQAAEKAAQAREQAAKDQAKSDEKAAKDQAKAAEKAAKERDKAGKDAEKPGRPRLRTAGDAPSSVPAAPGAIAPR